MTLAYYLKRALNMPPHLVLRRAAAALKRRAHHSYGRHQDQRKATYSSEAPAGPLLRYLDPVPVGVLNPYVPLFRDLSEHALSHRFDLLGSGWVQVAHGMPCQGVEGQRYPSGDPVHPDPEGRWLQDRLNAANLTPAQHRWSLIECPYQPIDWHLDFKSGFRWPETTWAADIPYGHLPGVDVKVPWELARMQHLPMLAWAYALSSAGTPDFRNPDAYLREFRNQVLDFIATNPPRFGVNWRMTMDVAIRVSNWLVAYDLFRAFGATFAPDFEEAFACSILDHGRHIARHLEWSDVLRGNHYLADIVGLLFVAAYLPRTPETDAWLALAVQELVAEVESQFTPDGANFEASTCYHRLSAEMVAYATALILGLPPEKQEALRTYDSRHVRKPPALSPAPLPRHPLPDGTDSPLPPWVIVRLERMREFTAALTQGDGRVPQFGDNDSGRFLKLVPAFCRVPAEAPSPGEAWREDQLDHRHLLTAIGTLFLPEDPKAPSLEAMVVRSFSAGRRLPSCRESAEPSPLAAFPEGGVYAYRAPDLGLVLRCGSVGQKGYGGHAHNDALSFELWVADRAFIVDPGTYLYTPAPELRNRFRSTAMHSTLALPGKEQNDWEDGVAWLFGLKQRAYARVIEATPERFIGEHSGFGSPHRRTLTLEERTLRGCDACEHPGEKHVLFHLAPEVQVAGCEDEGVILQRDGIRVKLQGSPGAWTVEESLYSPAYGVVQRNHVVRLTSSATRVDWEIVIGKETGDR